MSQKSNQEYVQGWADFLNEPPSKIRKLLNRETKKVPEKKTTGEVEVWLGRANPQVLKETFE